MMARSRNIVPSRISRGSEFANENLIFIPADAEIRPLRDQMIVEPLDVVYSRYLIVDCKTKPLRGVVRAIGPGHYPLKYLDAQGDLLPDWNRKARRQSTWSKHFVPTQIKVGDTVQLGSPPGRDGYAFEQFYWGDRVHLHCREADVCGIEHG